MTDHYIQSRPVRRPRSRRQLVLTLAVTLVVVGLLLIVASSIPLMQGRDAWMKGRDAEAIAIGEKWSRLHLWPSHYHQLLAAAYLTSGPLIKVRPHLDAIGSLRFPVIPKDELARRLFARGSYDDFLLYDAAVREDQEPPDVPLYRAAAMVLTDRFPQAQKVFASIDPARVDRAQYDALRGAIAVRASGSIPYVFDRNGVPIAEARGNQLLATNDDFAPLIARDAGALTFGANMGRLGTNATIETTLDPFVQKAALKALGGYRGALVAIDPRTNEIVAIASSRGNGPVANLALEHQFEPGSVVKVLTGLNAENGGADVASFFPYTCKGSLDIDGHHFADWLPAGHGVLNTIDDALAVSCNTFFADLGLRIGAGRLIPFMTAAGFDTELDLGPFRVPLGRIRGPIAGRFETAYLSIGLEHESMNALHVAMIASMMANRGELTTPRLLLQRRSILGDVVVRAPLQNRSRLASRPAAEIIVHAMEAVVTDPHGTGHRAQVPGISIAMKTGTAGERKNGLDAVILAFAPAESPRIAFGVIAENAGPADIAGAKIAHDFVEEMAVRLK